MSRCNILFLGLLTLATSSAHAAFNVQSNQWPTGDDNPYGNSRLGEFDRAISGGGDVPEKDTQELARQMPFKEKNKLYVRVRLNNATHELSGISNETDTFGGMNEVASASLVEESVQETRRGVELAVGTRGESWRWDVELVLNRNLELALNPPFKQITGKGVGDTSVNLMDAGTLVINQNAGPLNAKVENNALLGNFYYEFLNIHIFQPYVVGTVGLSVNRATTTNSTQRTDIVGQPILVGVNGQTHRSINIAFGGGVGTRFPLYRNFSFDVAYRMINLGKAKLRTAGSVIDLEGRRIMSGVSCGLIIFLG